jgi:hypothetical protein
MKLEQKGISGDDIWGTGMHSEVDEDCNGSDLCGSEVSL